MSRRAGAGVREARNSLTVIDPFLPVVDGGFHGGQSNRRGFAAQLLG
jgi:hypothetical protein